MQRSWFAAPRFGLFVVVTIFFILGLIYSAVVPLFEPPDELWHFAFADHLAKGNGLPVFSTTKSAFLREGGQPPLFYAVVALVILPFDRSDFPGWVRFNASHPRVTPGATSDTPNVFIHTAREDPPWTGSVLAVHVARLVSLVFGVLTVIGVYVAGRTATGRDDLALLSAALVAFTPQFVFICASVNNDSLMAATATWLGVASLQISNVRSKVSIGYAIGAGVVLGMGLMSKLSGLVLVPLAVLALAIRWFRQHPHLRFEIWYLTFAILGAATLISGWWYGRNVALYGDPLGWSVWLSDIGVRTPTPALWQLVPEFPALFRTFWADLGGLQFGDTIYIVLAGAALLALVGILKALFSNFQPLTSSLRLEIWNLIFVLLWFGIVMAGVLRYMQTTPAAQGRLLFPALAPIGVLMAWGLGVLLRTKRAWLPGSLVVVLLALTLAAPFVLIRPAFTKPLVTQLPADVRPADAHFGDMVELIGVQFAAEHVKPGTTLRVTTYWRALQDIPRDQRLLIRLMRPDGASAGQLDATLGTPLYPTTLWMPGQIVMDTHDVRADANLAAGETLRIHLGVGDETEPLLLVTGRQAWTSGDVADVGQVQVKQ